MQRPLVSRYDLLLLVLPAPLLAGAAAGLATGVPLPAAVGVGSLLAFAVLAYGLFVDPPIPVGAAGGDGGLADARAVDPAGDGAAPADD